MVWAGDLNAFCDNCLTTHKMTGLNNPSVFGFDPPTTNEPSDLEQAADRETKIAMFEQDNVSTLTEVFSITILLGAMSAVVLIALSFKLIFIILAMTRPQDNT